MDVDEHVAVGADPAGEVRGEFGLELGIVEPAEGGDGEMMLGVVAAEARTLDLAGLVAGGHGDGLQRLARIVVGDFAGLVRFALAGRHDEDRNPSGSLRLGGREHVADGGRDLGHFVGDTAGQAETGSQHSRQQPDLFRRPARHHHRAPPARTKRTDPTFAKRPESPSDTPRPCFHWHLKMSLRRRGAGSPALIP